MPILCTLITWALSLHRSAHFFGPFLILINFHRERGIEWRGILCPMHPVLLQPQTTYLAFCNNFDKQYCVFSCFFFINKILSFPKWRQKPACPMLHYSSVVNMEKCNFTNFEIHQYKTKKIATMIFFLSGDQEKKELIFF